jgi:heavy metal sensor kinase
MSRLPIRVRLALAFTVAMAVVLALVGVLLQQRLGDALLEQVDDGLESFAVSGVAASASTGGDDEIFVQVLGPGDRIRGVPSEPLVGEEERDRARASPFYLTRDALPHLGGEPARLRISSDPTDPDRATLVVGASLEDREEALDGLLTQLLVVGPLALVLTSVAGYFLAGAALRPVEAMRRRAAEISGQASGQRLPLPPAQDEIRRLGETLNEMVGRLEEGVARERRFVADASHELRTPLALLRAELELAGRRPRTHEELEDALGSAREEVNRLVRLAEDLLVLARADEGRLPLAWEEHLAREVLDAVAGRHDTRAREAGRTIEVDAPDDAVVSGDRLRLEQALGNLVENALRHGAGDVRLEAVENGSLLELRVSDEGPGFAAEYLPHAFERFSRADVARSAGGSGLGLAIVDAIARAHGGTVAAANGADGGAVVTMLIPLSFGGTHDQAARGGLRLDPEPGRSPRVNPRPGTG